MKCQQCGSEIGQGNKFCTNCGAPAAVSAETQENAPSTTKCQACGYENQAGHKFCENCGAKLTPDATTPASQAAISAPQGAPSAVPPAMPAGLPNGHATFQTISTPPANPYGGGQPPVASTAGNPYSAGNTGTAPNIAPPAVPPVAAPPMAVPPMAAPADMPPAAISGSNAAPAQANNVTAEQPAENIVVEDNKGKGKKGLWITLAIFFAIAAIVLLIMLITKNRHSYRGYEPYSSYDDTIAYPYYEAEEVVETAEATEATESYFSDRFRRVDVYGQWMSTSPVNVDVNLTTYSDGSISASGYAYYNNGDAIFTLRGSGENDGEAMTLNLNEYSDDGSYTGEWRGRVFVCGGRLNYYGHFYDTDGAETCYFDLYAE